MPEHDDDKLRETTSATVSIDQKQMSSGLAFIGPRQISESTKLLSELIQSFLNNIVKGEALPQPYKVQSTDLESLQLRGMDALVDDMLYEINPQNVGEPPRTVNISALLRSGRINFSQLILDTSSGRDNTRIADYIATHGVEGAQVDYAGNTKHVKSSLQNAEGDAQELVEAITKDKLVLKSARKKAMLSTLLKKPKKNLADLTKIVILQKSIIKINERINRARNLVKIKDGAKIREYLQHFIAQDEEFLALAQTNNQPWESLQKTETGFFTAKITTADKTEKEVLFNQKRYDQALRRLKAYEDLMKLDDTSLVALRLYTGDAYRITSTIFYNQEAGYKQWTPAQMSQNLLAACVLAHTTANNSTFHAKVTRVDGSPLIPTEARDAKDNEKFVEKSGPTSTSSIGPLEDFLKQAKTATISYFKEILGIDISAISVWRGEAEVLTPPGRLMVVKDISDQEGRVHIEFQHIGGYSPDDAEKMKLKDRSVIPLSLQDALKTAAAAPTRPVTPGYMKPTPKVPSSSQPAGLKRPTTSYLNPTLPGYMKPSASSLSKQVKSKDDASAPKPKKPTAPSK